MATFPALTPSSRTFTPGEYPHTPFTTYNGLQNRVRHSNVMLSSSLRLSFIALAEADMLSILSHYQGQAGGFESFLLPSSIWSGVTTISDYELTDYRWRYTEAPTVDDAYCSLYNVELALETVPPEGKFVGGAELAVIITLTAGVAVTANGLTESVTLSFTGGTATGGTAVTTEESAFWSTWNWQDSEPFLFAEGAADDDAGFAACLYWTQDLYTDWR